jgi:hypothetical protein
MSGDVIIIPFIKKTSYARKPMLSQVISGKFYYNLYSGEHGIRVLKDFDKITTNIGIFVPQNVAINLKSVFIESKNNKFVQTYSTTNELFNLKCGFHSEICLKIPEGMKFDQIKKGDHIGAFVTDKKVTFEEFSVNGMNFSFIIR